MKETIIEMEHYAEANNIPIIELDSIKFIMKYIKLNNVKNILEMIQKLYHWITTESEENHYDIVKMTFIWTIIAFIIGKIW